MGAHALQIFWRGALEQPQVGGAQRAEHLEGLLRIGFVLVQPLGPRTLVNRGLFLKASCLRRF